MVGGDEFKRIWVWFYVVFLMITWVGIDESYAQRAPQVPCFFIYGDSLVDNGNNNQIASLAKANYPPYGIDFPAGPTGRFCNGCTAADVIAQLLGFKRYPPPYATARGQAILEGVNYASGGAGILEETGRQLGDRISFSGQLKNFQNTTSQLVGLLGGRNATANYLSRCIYSVGFGSNDYINNYFMPAFYNSSRTYTPEQFASVLIQQYSQQLRSLYNYGARKVVLIGVGQIGCTPFELARFSPSGTQCVERMNAASRLFNDKLRGLVDNFNNNLPNARFIYINVYDIFDDILRNPSTYGIRVTNAGCCGVGRNNGQITCLPLQTPCSDRTGHLFWDAFHSTEATNVIVGRRSYAAQSPSDAYPIDIQLLAKLSV